MSEQSVTSVDTTARHWQREKGSVGTTGGHAGRRSYRTHARKARSMSGRAASRHRARQRARTTRTGPALRAPRPSPDAHHPARAQIHPLAPRSGPLHTGGRPFRLGARTVTRLARRWPQPWCDDAVVWPGLARPGTVKSRPASWHIPSGPARHRQAALHPCPSVSVCWLCITRARKPCCERL